MGDGAIDNRERLNKLCRENGLKIASTRLQKPIEEKVTYKPLGLKGAQKEPPAHTYN